MAKYQIKVKKKVKKTLRQIPLRDVEAIRDKVRMLADNPRPDGCKKLVKSDNLYRVRSGNYRVVYAIQDDILVIIVIRISHRKDVYC
ncbi:type II toxin-antitoxin system RelE family toxin [Tunicatimonas pelagia]|uniref:type II toxin-antitoxin system RelE family toxin n=1 Tax=Tunicatimonas pelagia TaxID=931531 RepID=UPI00345C9F30